MSRVFLTRLDSTYRFGLSCASRLSRRKRAGDAPRDTRVALRAGELIIEAKAGERIHSQIFLRAIEDPEIGEAFRAALAEDRIESGFTVDEDEAIYERRPAMRSEIPAGEDAEGPESRRMEESIRVDAPAPFVARLAEGR